MLTRTGLHLSDGRGIDDLINVETREVSLSVLSDREVYALEMERIFARTWLLLGHDSEIPNAGDYVVRDMGADPVIVARGRDGQIHVSLNVCPHRGMRVCRDEAGNTQVHRCSYHGWAFRPNGDFLGAPVEREQMHGDVYPKEQLGLRKARVALYGGLIFAAWRTDGPSLDEFLGDAKWYYDMLFCRTQAGLEVLGPPQRLMINANWKTAGEQSGIDGFHTLTLHRSLFEQGVLGGDAAEAIYASAPSMYGIDIGDAHGHALRCIRAEQTFAMVSAMNIAGMSLEERLAALPPPGITHDLLPELKAKLDPIQYRLMGEAPPQVGGIFPNVSVLFIYAPQADGTMGAALGVHAFTPRGPEKLEFLSWFFAEKDAPEAMKAQMRRHSARLMGTSGAIEQDDAETWPHMTRNSIGPMGGRGTMKYQALLGENRPEGWPGGGMVYDGFTKDDNQWLWWLYWRELMMAGE